MRDEPVQPPTTSILKASLIGPLAVIPAAVILVMAQEAVSYPVSRIPLFDALQASLLIGLLGLVYAYVFTILYGLPVDLLLRAFGWTGVVPVSLAAIAPGLIYGWWAGIGIVQVFVFGWFALPVALSCHYLANSNNGRD